MPSDPVETLRSALPTGYSVERALKAGGQGSVFLGALNGAQVALKVFRPDHEPERLGREIKMLGKLKCPNLVKLVGHEVVCIDGASYPLVAYEYLAGGDLRQCMQQPAGQFAPQEVAQIGADIGQGIEVLWRHRIVHRDVKPDNIIKGKKGQFVLVDVGFAVHLDLSRLTAIGRVAGTPGYQSPEQAHGRRNLTIHSDVFSLGITLAEVAAKTHPFNGAQHFIGQQRPKDLGKLRPDFPRPLVRLIHQMLATRPADRPNKVTERFRELLEIM